MGSWAEAVRKLLHLFATCALALGCRSEATSPQTGSETHFLSHCGNDATCDDAFDCVCGVCTTECTSSAACSELSAFAECLPRVATDSAECASMDVASACDVTCELDGDCASLSGAHRCDQGVCRSLAEDCGRGDVTGNDVALLGDQFIANTRGLTLELEALARETGALGGDEGYRDYSSPLITPFGEAMDLSTQYDAAVMEGVPRVVIMNAGGPNALLTCPEPPTEDCPALAEALSGVEAMWQEMASDGVQTVVNFFYPDPEDTTLKAKFDVLRSMLEAGCAASPVECHFVDLRSAFEANSDELLQPAGILPTDAGSAVAAEVIFRVMQQRCIAQ